MPAVAAVKVSSLIPPARARAYILGQELVEGVGVHGKPWTEAGGFLAMLRSRQKMQTKRQNQAERAAAGNRDGQIAPCPNLSLKLLDFSGFLPDYRA